MKVFKFVIYSLIVFFFSGNLFSQSITGKIASSDPLGIVIKIDNSGISTETNYEGVFKFYDLTPNDYTILIVDGGEEKIIAEVKYVNETIDLGLIEIVKEEIVKESEEDSSFGVISLADNELEIDDDLFESSGILSASRDPYLSTVAFAWGASRFNARGLTSEFTYTTINGIRMNELNNGRVFYGQWGGLNDMFRNLQTSYGLSASEYGIGFMGGGVDFNIRAGSQRAQTRISYARSNRSYNNRVMLTHSTGFNQKGWAFSLSGSHRWAQEGHVTGSFYDTWSYFLGVEKIINDNHNVYLNVISAMGSRGKTGAALQEVSEIVDDKFYNPYWGWQNGEKRNSRVSNSNQPIIMMGNDLKLGKRTSWSNAISYQFGNYGNTALQWLDASNPSADYYRKLPSHIENEDLRNQVIDIIEDNPDYFQVDWDFLYEANRDNNRTIQNANGTGETIEGNFARYLVEDRRNDTKELNFTSRINHQLADNNSLDIGINLSHYQSNNFTLIDDLLGADFYHDIDRFADAIARPGTEQKDLNNPNAVKTEGDVFGYDYDGNIRYGQFWMQDQISLSQFDLFAGAEISATQYWRTGNMRNGYFPEDSFGDSEKKSFKNYKLKAGVTYKLGRNRLFAKAYSGTRAPYFNNAFISPRINNSYVPHLENVKEKSMEVGYGFKSPSIDLRATGYYVDINDDSELFFFYSEEDFSVDGEIRSGAFGSFINHNVDKRHVGIELLAQVKLNSTTQIKAVSSIGQHLYDTRWRQWGFSDELGYFREDMTIYSNNFYVETTPQKAFNLELKYDSPNYWFATLNLNYFGNRYLDFSTDRRNELATASLEEGSPEFANVINQEKLDDAMTLDLFFHKSFKLKNDHFILLTASISNLLNEDFYSGGYEQLRYDTERGPEWFDTKYYRAYGTNFYIGITYKI